MKNIFYFFCVLIMSLTFVACTGQGNLANETSPKVTSSQAEGTQESKPAENPQASEPTENLQASETESKGGNVLVVYFSATGNTKTLAEYVAHELGADLYEITPEEPYTTEELNYNDNNSRSSIEQNDESARPIISGGVEDIEQYDTIFLGYPIWWGQAPRIVYTFIESYDFSGKTIVPFCTSGSSGIGSSAENLHSLAASDVNWLDGERMGANSTRENIISWLDSLDINVMVAN